MGTSGSVDFNQTRTELVTDALSLIGVIEQGEAPAAATEQYCVRQLNKMVKTWQADGVRLWTRREAYLFLVKSQADYRLGSGGGTGEHFARVDDTFRTAIATAVVALDSSLVVDSTADMTASDNIGVVLDDDTIEWDTIASVTNSTTVALTGSISAAAAVDKAVFTYTTLLGRPLKVLDVERTSDADLDTPIATIPHRRYQRLPNKTIDGLTNEVYYQPERPDGFLHAWPRPETAADRLRLTCMFPIEDFDNTSDNPDFPQEWLDCLTFGLADRLIPSYGAPQATATRVTARAVELYEKMSGWDREPEDTQFVPEFLWEE